KIAVMWRNALAGSRDLYSAISTDRGRTFAPARKLGSATWTLNACPMDGGAIAWTGQPEPEAVWRRDTTIYLGRADRPEAKLAANAMQPLIVSTPAGRNMLWENDGNLVLQLASTDPAPFAKKARAASLISLPDGRLAIAWESSLTGAPRLLFAVP
ncbi:MAG TPA: hypothetical protein VD994_14130, partial [Prosthecobacter sp.]|nr:hypothetical protein [Prosthecobacter sp.]